MTPKHHEDHPKPPPAAVHRKPISGPASPAQPATSGTARRLLDLRVPSLPTGTRTRRTRQTACSGPPVRDIRHDCDLALAAFVVQADRRLHAFSPIMAAAHRG